MKLTEEKIILKRTEPLSNELSDFLSSIIEEREPLVSGQSGLSAVKIVDAGLKITGIK